MIVFDFKKRGGRYAGFEVGGHSGYADYGADIVCAAVSSAVNTVANGITELCGAESEVSVREGEDNAVSLELIRGGADALLLIETLKLQADSLAEEYPENVKVILTEV